MIAWLRTFFAAAGFFVLLLATAGALGIGHFRAYYGPDDVRCIPIKENGNG